MEWRTEIRELFVKSRTEKHRETLGQSWEKFQARYLEWQMDSLVMPLGTVAPGFPGS